MCDAAAKSVTQLSACPNDAPAEKRSCLLCVQDGYSWCQDASRELDEYAGRCVSFPNGPNPWIPHTVKPAKVVKTQGEGEEEPVNPPVDPTKPGEGEEEGPEEGEEEDENEDDDSWGMCGPEQELIYQAQDCPAVVLANGADWHRWEGGPHAGWWIALGVLKFILIGALVCCCCRRCRRRCKERCQAWRERRCGRWQAQAAQGGQGGCCQTTPQQQQGGVTVQDGCSFVGGAPVVSQEEQQLQQALAASFVAPSAPHHQAPPAAVHVAVSVDRKDGVVEMQPQGQAYPSLNANRNGYAPVQQIPDI